MGYFTLSPEEAESAFYSAFENLDMDLMKATWHQSDSIFCIHPGGPIQTGLKAVLNHWSYILKNSQPSTVNYKVVSTQKSDTVAVHLVEETIGMADDSVLVLVTNTYINTSEGWRLFSHHASLPPMANPAKQSDVAIH